MFPRSGALHGPHVGARTMIKGGLYSSKDSDQGWVMVPRKPEGHRREMGGLRVRI